MRKTALVAGALLALAIPSASQAALAVGARAPDFTGQSAMGGKVETFNLRAALRRGPVVLYFFPAAFTQGCTLETHAFADAMDQFHAAHATVIGMSADDLPTLQKFSTEECRSKFAMVTATPAIIRSYDVAMTADMMPEQYRSHFQPGRTARTSYVIAPNGRVTMVHTDLDYRDHVRLTLEAVQALSQRH
jgi:peroxiredoxin